MAAIVIPVTIVSWAIDAGAGRGTLVVKCNDAPNAGGSSMARGALISIDAAAADIQALTLVEGQAETLTLSTT